ncbi:MAG: 30S ribosomal protein S1, partial [Candidatus Krumholzibacteriia bacterium]
PPQEPTTKEEAAPSPAAAEQTSKQQAPEAEPREARKTAPESETSSEFAQLLDKGAAGATPREVKVGERVRGRIVTIADDQTFIDFSGRSEASIATSELRGPDGKVLMRVGDMLSATVSSVDDSGQVTLTLGRKRGALNAAKLRLSFENGVPVSGTVRGVNKGGFDVSVGGVRAFCPLSQIDNTFVEDPKPYVGRNFTFRVLRWEKSGRNIVVSRRAILKEESKRLAEETRKRLEVDAEFDGVVSRVQPFGAFVDLGGLEGLLHISRMGHGHIDDPSTVVSPGKKVRVRVVKLENPGTKKERIALALADLGPDPWDNIGSELQEGAVIEGTVVRLTPFGAFVRLGLGVDGLVHVSELANKRIADPKEAVAPGDEVQVRVLRIDTEKRRISLSIRQALSDATGPPRPSKREGRPGRPGRGRDQAGTPAPGNVPLTHNMADQLGALNQKLQERR